MEDMTCKENEQTTVYSKCANTSGVVKSNSISASSPQIVGRETLGTKIAAPTPEKAYEPVRNIHDDETAELPESYKVIAEFFNRMTCSLRLLALRKKLPTFESVSRQVQILTGRKFSYKHLSQIKHVLPEAVHTDKILIHDKKTSCMKPDIKITLSFEVTEGHQEQSPFTALQQLFMSRLLDMAAMHPKVPEIPEAEMPEPFNQRSVSITIDALPAALSTESQSCALQTELLSNATHLSSSFNKCFSEKIVDETEKKTRILSSLKPTSCARYDCSNDQVTGSDSKSITISNSAQPPSLSSSVTSSTCETTPLKVAGEADSLTLQTPAQVTPKRSIPSCDNKLKTMTSQSGTPYSAKRSLDFSLTEGEENSSSSTAVEVDRSKFVEDTGTITMKGKLVEDNLTESAVLLGKGETSCCTSMDHNMHETSLAQQKMPAGLSDLIPLIHQTFQSVNRSSITKDELIYKIIINNCEIIERREVEEQIDLLEKLVPDWICSKLAASGDVLYNIKKQSDPNTVCRRLFEQVTRMPNVGGIESS